jgi:hypothetical protein
MISPHKMLTQVAGAFDYLVGVGAVTNDVAEIYDQVKGRSCRQAALQRFEIAMDVAQQEYAHDSPGELVIIDRNVRIGISGFW